MSSLVLATAPTLYPITIDDLKIHLRIDDDTGYEDNLLDNIIYAAIAKVESITNRKLLTQTWDYYMDSFPDVDYYKLPFGNLQTTDSDVTHIKYTDSDGTQTTMTVTTDYIVETNGTMLGRIVLPYDTEWPSFTAYPSNPIVTRFACGWTSASAVPFEIKAAIMMICADLYTNRESQYLGINMQRYTTNPTVINLLGDYRLWEEF